MLRAGLVTFLLCSALACAGPDPAATTTAGANLTSACAGRRNGTPCDDGEPCNGPEACRAGRCVNLGRWVADGTSCADADVCNGDEACAGGACTPGLAPATDDGDACTLDGCTADRGVFHDPVAACTAGGTDFLPGGQPLPIVIAGARWADDGPGAATSFITRDANTFHLSLHRQAADLAAYLDRAAGLTDGFVVQCVGEGCPLEHAHPDGAPAIWFGTASDFATDPVVVAAFPDPTGPVAVEARQRYVLTPANGSYYVLGATDRATDPALWSLLRALGYRHFAPGPAWEVFPQPAALAEVAVVRDETPRVLYHGFLVQPDPQSGFGQEEWFRHNGVGDDSLRPMQGQAISGSHHDPAYPALQVLTEVVPHWMPEWRVEVSRLMAATRDCHATCRDAGGTDVDCAYACLPTGSVPPETLCAPIFSNAPAVTVQSADPAAQEAIDDYFSTLAIAFFRAYPEADTFSLELSDRTTPACDGACCDASCAVSPGAATTDAYVALANRVAARVRACDPDLCRWNDPAAPRRKLIVTALYNMTGTPPTVGFDADVVAMANLDHADPRALDVAGQQAATVGYYGYAFVERGVVADTHPANAADYVEHLAALDARVAPKTNQWLFLESYRAAMTRMVQWQALFQYTWGAPGTRAEADALVEDFFTSAFPEATSRARVRRFYDDLRLLDSTPSDEVLGRLFWHIAEARALAEQGCSPSVCGAPGDVRYERMLDRFDSLTLYVHERALEYHRLDDVPHPGVWRWADVLDPAADLLPLGEFLARSQAPVGAQGAALFDSLAQPTVVAAYLAANPGPAAPFDRADVEAMAIAGRNLYPAGWLAPEGGVPTMPVFSDALVAPPPGVPVACADEATCGDFAPLPAQAATSFQYFDYQVELGDEPVFPKVVGLGESPGYFIQVWSDADARWLDLFGGRQVRTAPANCVPLDLTADELAEVATLAHRRVRLRAGYSGNSAPGVCEDELWTASPRRAVRGPLSPQADAQHALATTVQHFFVPPGVDHLDTYGLAGACLVAPSGETITVGNAVDGTCRFEVGVPCPCTGDGEPIIDAAHRFVPGAFLREAAIPLDGASWGIWRLYKTGTAEVMPMTLRNVPPYFAARAELLPLPAECVTADGQGAVDRCGQ
ncbi:MAG: hypothetical protein K8W52_37640 [Deltaproteobacteria bacterium]|nr:hypothetical protein [Deltaproteobacteria bacterium]